MGMNWGRCHLTGAGGRIRMDGDWNRTVGYSTDGGGTVKWGDIILAVVVCTLLVAMAWLMKMSGWSFWGHW